jgi:hypothetical protein
VFTVISKSYPEEVPAYVLSVACSTTIFPLATEIILSCNMSEQLWPMSSLVSPMSMLQTALKQEEK